MVPFTHWADAPGGAYQQLLGVCLQGIAEENTYQAACTVDFACTAGTWRGWQLTVPQGKPALPRCALRPGGQLGTSTTATGAQLGTSGWPSGQRAVNPSRLSR